MFLRQNRENLVTRKYPIIRYIEVCEIYAQKFVHNLYNKF